MQCTHKHSTKGCFTSFYTEKGLLHISYFTLSLCIKPPRRKTISIFRREISTQSIFLKDIKGKYTLIRLFLPSQPYITSFEGSLENKLQTIQYTTSALVRWTRNQKKQIGINHYMVEVLYTAENAFIPVHYMQSKLEGKSRWSLISQLVAFSPLWYYL